MRQFYWVRLVLLGPFKYVIISVMKKSVAVISLGKFGIQLAISLSQGYDVIAIDSSSERVDEIKELVNFAVVLDATDEKSMRSVNADTVDIAVVSMGTNVQSVY